MSTLSFIDVRGQRFAMGISLILTGLLITGTLVCNHWFISPSQTAFFLYTLLASLCIGISGLWIFIQKKASLTLPFPVISITLLSLYVLMHGLFANTGITSSHIYLIISCLFLIACLYLPIPLSQTGEALFTIIASLAGIEAGICILQYAGMLPSQNIYFRATGTWMNPNVTALFLAMSVPVFLYFLLYGQRVYKRMAGPVFLLVLVALICLQCRTAWLGTVTVTVLIMNHRYQLWQHFKNQLGLLAKTLVTLTVMAVLLSAAIFAYRFKKDSADGRMLVWKICLQMIVQKPITGYGYGSFEQAYNLQQVNYFKSGQGALQEKYQADYVRMAYNELLQHAVEGGGLGLLLFISVIIPLLIPPRMHTGTTMAVYAGVVGFAVMSLVNFTIQAIPGLCLFLIYAATLLQAKSSLPLRINKKIAGALLITAGMYFFITQALTASAQRQNHYAAIAERKKNYQKAGRLLQPLTSRLATSDTYWQNYGRLLFEQKNYSEAVSMFTKAKAFTANPEVYLQTGFCYERMGAMAKAVQEFDVAAWLQPNRLTPHHALLQLYLTTNDTLAALQQAREMMAIREKGHSAKASQFKKEADSVINSFRTVHK